MSYKAYTKNLLDMKKQKKLKKKKQKRCFALKTYFYCLLDLPCASHDLSLPRNFDRFNDLSVT